MAQITPSPSSQSQPERPVGPVAHGVDDEPAPEPLEELDEEPSGFAAETLAELRRVVWPSRQQLFSESIAVILMVSLSAAAIAAIDRFYTWVASQVFR